MFRLLRLRHSPRRRPFIGGPGARGVPPLSCRGELCGFWEITDRLPVWPAGKVHGSLARAGKVRGQTPKVAKQDKKKQPKGRAMKRIKYNRRFVTAGACSLSAPGKKRTHSCVCGASEFHLSTWLARL